MKLDENTKARGVYPLTHPEKRIWYLEKIYPNTSFNNIGGYVRISGNINFGVLGEAINLVIKKNDAMRFNVLEDEDMVSQYVKPYEKYTLDFNDFSTFDEPMIEFSRWMENLAKTSFKLINNNLFYFAFFKIADNDCGYVIKLHHFIADGWSVNIITNQVTEYYLKLINNEVIDDCNENSYLDYLVSEKSYINSEKFLKNKAFWNEKFKTIPQFAQYKGSYNTAGARKSCYVDRDRTLNLKKYIQETKSSLNTFFMAVFLIYLHKVTQENDLVIGSPVLNRSNKKERDMIGMFTSTIPFRFEINPSFTVEEMIYEVNKELRKCFYNQKYPYDLLVQDLELNKKGVSDLYNICVNYYNTKHETSLMGATVENIEFYNGNQVYSLQLVIKDWTDSGNLTLNYDYKVDLYTEKQIEDMHNHICNIIDEILVKPNVLIKDISLLSQLEKNKLLYDFNKTKNNYPKNKTIYQLFMEQVEKTPNKTAVRLENIEVTYSQLNERSNKLARVLVGYGVGQNVIVGLMMTHSIECIVAILAILKAGGAYLPIDINYPTERVDFMLTDSEINVIITNLEESHFDDISFNGEILFFDDINLENVQASNLNSRSDKDDLAYIIYTSGSTGKPKGTMINHMGLVNYTWWAKKVYTNGTEEAFPLYSSLAFDLTVTSIFTPLISGNEIIIYQEDDKEYVLYKILKDNKATVMKLTPAHLALLKELDNTNSNITKLIVGGEDLKVNLARRVYESFGGKVQIFNEYGPTETVVGCMLHQYDYVEDKETSVPIGVPADNVQIYILDKNLEPVPINEVGEIYISGDGVSKGYLNRPKETKERFVNNHFIDGMIMYKTGDLAKFLDNGIIEYVGRSDHQVKIKGYRIELKEIEEHLLKYEGIKEVIVLDYELHPNNKCLCVYYVSDIDISSEMLVSFLSKSLPPYMIPLYFIKIDKIPITVNGKVDKNQLPNIESTFSLDEQMVDTFNDKELILIEALKEILNVKEIGLKDNFFYLGGDSIKAIQLSSKLMGKKLQLKVKDILSNPIVQQMALFINLEDKCVIDQSMRSGLIKTTPIIQWFLSQNFNNPHHYNQSIWLETKETIQKEDFEIVIKHLIEEHDSLRINYHLDKQQLYYNNDHLQLVDIVEEYNLQNYSSGEQKEKMIEIGNQVKESFNISNGLLIKCILFNLGSQGTRLLLTAHHLIVDGISWRILVNDINTIYDQIKNSKKVNIPEKTHSYQDWANHLSQISVSELQEEKKYWEQTLETNFQFPTDYDLGKDDINTSETLIETLNKEETTKLLTEAHYSFNTETQDLLITALARTICQMVGVEEIVIELESHGREENDGVNLTRTVGWFTSLFPFCINLSQDSLNQQIKEIKEQLRNIPRKGNRFGVIKHLAGLIETNAKKYIRFNYLGEFVDNQNQEEIQILSLQSGNEISGLNDLTSLIDINCYVVNNQLNIAVTYSNNRFKNQTMERFITLLISEIREVIDFTCTSQVKEFTPSDFNTIDITQEELDSLFI